MDCDIEVFVVLFFWYGNKVFLMIDGMFFCIIYDDLNGNIVVVRDWFGIKLFYIVDDENGFCLFLFELVGIKVFFFCCWEYLNIGIE